MRAYVLVEAKVGMARGISEALRTMSLTDGRILSVDVVTGPYDIIACWRPMIWTASAGRSPSRSKRSRASGERRRAWW